jgi:hypothetical protein
MDRTTDMKLASPEKADQKMVRKALGRREEVSQHPTLAVSNYCRCHGRGRLVARLRVLDG